MELVLLSLEMTMCSSKYFLFLSLIFSTILFLTVSQESKPLHHCIDAGNYTSNSTYHRNLITLLSTIPSNMDKYGYFTSFVGHNSDRVYATALCRGDVELDLCRGYISNLSRGLLTEFCPGYKQAVSWPEKCNLRYSSEDMTGILTSSPMYSVYITQDVESKDPFNQAVRSLMEGLRDKAAAGGSLRKFATGDTPGPDFMTIYGLVQCTPDLSENQCKDCLQSTFGFMGQCCSNKTGVKILSPSCNMRYELHKFYEDTVVVVDAPPPDTSSKAPPPDTGIVMAGKKKKNNTATTTVLLAVVASSFSILIGIIGIQIFIRRKKHKKPYQDLTTADETSTTETLLYDFDTIKNATNDFSEANELGQGGFGVVYKGELPSGEEIAVKRLTRNSRHGEEQFKNEVVSMVKLQHRNLVRLLGFCLKGTERLLITEFLINSSLDNFIFGKNSNTNAI